MALTSIADQKTPGRPVEITFEADTGIPSAVQEVLIIGHREDASSGNVGAIAINTVTTIANAGDLTAASGECMTKFGDSEITDMVLAAIKACQDFGNYPTIKAIPLAQTETGFGASDAALTTAKTQKAEFIVSPYDGTDATLAGKLKDAASAMSTAQRVHNNQFGTVGCIFNRSVTDPTTLNQYDTAFLMAFWLRDTGTGGDAPAYSVAEMCAALTARIAANPVPFNPMNDVSVGGVDSPAKDSDKITVGAALESESCLNKGWVPMMVKPNGEVAYVRTVLTLLSRDGTGTPLATSYYDLQDYQVLYYFRKSIYTRFSQPDFKQRKASAEAAREIKSEAIRLATVFQDQEMFQAVDQLAKEFQVERSASDRSRFDLKIPVNVIPGLHMIATNISATTRFDTILV